MNRGVKQPKVRGPKKTGQLLKQKKKQGVYEQEQGHGKDPLFDGIETRKTARYNKKKWGAKVREMGEKNRDYIELLGREGGCEREY